MLRMSVAAIIAALTLPTLAEAQAPPNPPGNPRPHGQPHGAPPPGPHPGFAAPRPHGVPPHPVIVAPHAVIGVPHPVVVGPRPGVLPGQFTYRGRTINRIHLAPFVYPNGWAYRRWTIGAILPPLFLAPAYYYVDWAALGLSPPQPGFQWVRYGPDLLLVNVATGEVVDVVYDAID
jgi:Nickel/cobalt transporter regulator